MGSQPDDDLQGDECSLRELAATISVEQARANPIDGAVCLAAMDEELEALERDFRAAQEQQELLRHRKVALSVTPLAQTVFELRPLICRLSHNVEAELEGARDVAGSCTVCLVGAIDLAVPTRTHWNFAYDGVRCQDLEDEDDYEDVVEDSSTLVLARS